MPKNDLTPEQIDDLKDLLVERMVDNMSTKDLVVYVTDDLTEYYKDLSDKEFLNEAENYWDDHFLKSLKKLKKSSKLFTPFVHK